MSKPATFTVMIMLVGMGLVLAYFVGGMRTQLQALEKQATAQSQLIAKQDILIADLEGKLAALPYRGTRMIERKPLPPHDGKPLLDEDGNIVLRAPRPDEPGSYKLLRVRMLESTRDVLYVLDRHTNRLLALTFDSGKGKVELIAGREIKNIDGFDLPPDPMFADSVLESLTLRTDVGEDSLAVLHNASHMLEFYRVELSHRRIVIAGSVDLWKVFNESEPGTTEHGGGTRRDAGR